MQVGSSPSFPALTTLLSTISRVPVTRRISESGRPDAAATAPRSCSPETSSPSNLKHRVLASSPRTSAWEHTIADDVSEASLKPLCELARSLASPERPVRPSGRNQGKEERERSSSRKTRSRARHS